MSHETRQRWCRREADDRSRVDVANSGLGRLNWADSCPTKAASEGPETRTEQSYAKRFINASASAISGISGVGEKPSSAGPRTAWASIGRAVDWYSLASESVACSSKLRAFCACAVATAARKASSAGAGFAGSRLKRM